MATQTVNIGGFGPFLYDDTAEKAIQTEGDIEVGNVIPTSLSENKRMIESTTTKVLSEIEDLTEFIGSGIGIIVVNDGDGTVTIKRQQAVVTITSANSPYTAVSDRTILVDASGADVTINLPTVVDNDGLEYVIKRIDNTANTVTVDGNGTEVIEDTETKTLLPGDSMYIISDATQWWII